MCIDFWFDGNNASDAPMLQILFSRHVKTGVLYGEEAEEAEDDFVCIDLLVLLLIKMLRDSL